MPQEDRRQRSLRVKRSEPQRAIASVLEHEVRKQPTDSQHRRKVRAQRTERLA
jgi:hypothetical protein